MNEIDFIEQCTRLAPILASNAAEGERLRIAPSDSMHRIESAGLLGVVTPKSLGGHGHSLQTLCAGTSELAQGCPATAWTASFLMIHAWMLSRFPEQFRAELFADGTMPKASAPLTPSGTITPVDGGYTVSGRWEWATAINESDWVTVHGFDTGVEFGTRFAVLPRSEVTVEDVWHTSGMRATGSNVVVVQDSFVPTHRTIDGQGLMGAGGGTPDDRFKFLPVPLVLALTASAPAVGAAERGAELYRERLSTRILAYSLGDRAADQPLAQARLGQVMSDLAMLKAGWFDAISRIEAASKSQLPTDLLRVQTRLAAAAAVRSSRLLLGTIGEGAGASVYNSKHDFQRLQRDVETLKGHVVFDWDRTTELAGRVALGHSLQPTDMA